MRVPASYMTRQFKVTLDTGASAWATRQVTVMLSVVTGSEGL